MHFRNIIYTTYLFSYLLSKRINKQTKTDTFSPLEKQGGRKVV